MTATVRFSLAALLVAAAAPAQEIGYKHTRQPTVRIPFNAGINLRRVELYVSTDEGRDWREAATADPADREFRYAFPADARYWFAVRSLDNSNRYIPADLRDLVPQVKVVYDTTPPVALLRSAADSRPNTVTCEWEVRDENLDLGRFAVDWRIPGVSDWARDDRGLAAATGALSWTLKPGVRMEVRLRVADKAGNETAQQLTLGVGADGRAIEPPPGEAGNSAGVNYSNQLKLSLTYQVAKVPPSGMPVFELWYTRDKGAAWTKAPKEDGAATPGTLPANPGQAAEARNGKLVFNATEQGLYGFRIVARNGVGIGDPDPKSGDVPKHWVEIDTDAPKVELRADAGKGYDVRNVTIQWRCTDKNLAEKPVKLFYAEKKGDAEPADGDWKPIPGLGPTFDAQGVQTWTVGRDGPHRFLIRATGADKAGNLGRDQTRDPLVVDLEHPAVNITLIEPAGKEK